MILTHASARLPLPSAMDPDTLREKLLPELASALQAHGASQVKMEANQLSFSGGHLIPSWSPGETVTAGRIRLEQEPGSLTLAYELDLSRQFIWLNWVAGSLVAFLLSAACLGMWAGGAGAMEFMCVGVFVLLGVTGQWLFLVVGGIAMLKGVFRRFLVRAISSVRM